MFDVNVELALAGLGLLAVTACDTAHPVMVIRGNGVTFRGAASNTFLHGGSFLATNGKATAQAPTTNLPISAPSAFLWCATPDCAA